MMRATTMMVQNSTLRRSSQTRQTSELKKLFEKCEHMSVCVAVDTNACHRLAWSITSMCFPSEASPKKCVAPFEILACGGACFRMFLR
mmetsp:Transcript_51622/g.81996  ORF Transcript_51622/g.81996 Transcript_51622/m.81996 type:complete len:88 (+) Transcript_51622:984-1247(+)